MVSMHTLRRSLIGVVAVALVSGGVGVTLAEGEGQLDQLIRDYLGSRGAEVQLAPPAQLARRYAIDLTGVVPSPADIGLNMAKSPAEMFDYFRQRGQMPHTGNETAYVWINLLHDADHFLFSNSNQFSQPGHIREFRDQLRRVYADGWSFREFTRWALESQMFLNRFPSGADRANAAFFLFLGRDSFSSEVPVGNMWNGYALRNPGIPASQAETNPDYHVYDYDDTRCTSGDVDCSARFWSGEGSTPSVAIDMMLASPLFAEATVDRYWLRFMGTDLPGVDFPDLRRTLAQGFVSNGYDVNWLIKEITTSAAYVQEMMFR